MFVKLTLLISLFLFLGIVGHGQEPCRKTVAEGPELSHFKLGMSYQEVQKIIPVFAGMIYFEDGGTVFESFVDRPPPKTLTGLRALYLRFFEDKLFQIEVFYEEQGGSTKLADFTARLSAELGLSATAWLTKYNQASLNCGEFLLTADTVLNPHAELTDTAARAEFDKKQQQNKSVKKKS